MSTRPSRPRPKAKPRARDAVHLRTPPEFGYWDLDEQGQPYFAGASKAAVARAAARFERGDYRIWRTEKDERWVGTIFLWINHQWGSGPPILFETAASCGGKIVVCERYSTRSQARIGHRKWCKTYLDS